MNWFRRKKQIINPILTDEWELSVEVYVVQIRNNPCLAERWLKKVWSEYKKLKENSLQDQQGYGRSDH